MWSKYIKIIALLFLVSSCDDVIEVEDISDKSITVLAPSDTSVLTIADVVFSWNEVDEAEHYKLQIASPAFSSATQIVLDTLVTSTSFVKTLESGDYQWRIRAENSEYNTAYSINSFSVLEPNVVVDISNNTVTLLSPANALVFKESDTINFSWETVLNADNYTIQIAIPTFEKATQIVVNEVVDTASFSIASLVANTYEWRVKARNVDYETIYTTQSFTVEK